ncbi:MAG: recombinase family protein [Albidovulum sp.]|nr:recombinase family protein [Albidovulum sp.]
MFRVFAAIAHFERQQISERTKDGLRTARKHGRTPGRTPLHADTVCALQELVNNGTSAARAAKYVGIGRSTAYRAIRETRP